MSIEPAISVSNLSKAYPLFARPWDRLRHLLTGRPPTREFKALNGIGFEVAKGESVGIIGRNGSGKSTLLQIIAGTLTPSQGEARVSGRVAALLELGSGFNPEFTGRENVYLNGAILGLNRAQMDELFDEIAAFADIGDFIDEPVKEYSSGMMMRLAFAVQVALQPDILIVDEALSVGDFFFQQKCLHQIQALKEKGTTLLFVSHDMGVVRDMCERVLYLRRGELIFEGEAHVGIRQYLNESADVESTRQGEPAVRPPLAETGVVALTVLQDYLSRASWISSDQNIMSGTRIICVIVEDDTGRSGLTADIGDKLKFRVVYRVDEAESVHVSIVLKNRYDQIVNCTSTYTLGVTPPVLSEGVIALAEIEMRMMVEAGQYTFHASLGTTNEAEANRGKSLDETPWIGPLSISWDFASKPAPFLGMFGIPAEANISCIGAAGK